MNRLASRASRAATVGRAARPWTGWPLLAVGVLASVGAGFLTDQLPGRWSHTVLVASTWMLLAAGLNLYVITTRKLMLCQAVFFGAGAYVFGILTVRYHVGPILAMLAAMLSGGVVGLFLALTVARLTGHYFGIATLAVNLVFTNFLFSLPITGGASGLVGVPSVSIGPWDLDGSGPTVTVLALLVVACAALTVHTASRPFGHILRAAYQNRLLVESWGIRVGPYETTMLVASAVVAALAGVIYASSSSVLVPDSFTVWASFQSLIFIVVGGMGSIIAPMAAAVLLTVLPESVRWTGSLELALYGAVLAVMMIVLPGGMASIPRRLSARRALINTRRLAQQSRGNA